MSYRIVEPLLNGIEKDSPVAATQFAVLMAALCAPITYMQLLDGHAYGAGGLTAMYWADGGLGLLACGLLAAFLVLSRRWSFSSGMHLSAATPERSR